MTLINDDYRNMKLGEILVSMHLVTEEQVYATLTIAKKVHSKIGSALVKEGIITLDNLKTALKMQLGIDAVSEEQISSLNSNTVSILPEDFIKMYYTVPINTDNRVLTVGMVNPKNNSAITNIIAFTGMQPKVLVLTQYEFYMIIKKFFNR